jgi:hypothetical protein
MEEREEWTDNIVEEIEMLAPSSILEAKSQILFTDFM